MRVAPVAALILAAVLAGCLGVAPSGGQAASPVPVARQPGVDDPKNVTVRVVDPTDGTNASIPGAHVVFWTKVADDSVTARYYTEIETCPSSLDEAPFAVLAEGTTGPDGRVVGQVRPVEAVETDADWLPVNVAVVPPDGYTTEAYAHAETGTACSIDPVKQRMTEHVPGPDSRLTVPVYPTEATVQLNGSIGPTIAAAPEGVDARQVWWPRNVSLDVQHLVRLETLRAELSWSNGGADWADLYLGLGRDGDEPRVTGPDRVQEPDPDDERHYERLHYVGDPPFLPLRLGPVTDQPVVTADRIEYRIQAELTFAGADIAMPTGPVGG